LIRTNGKRLVIKAVQGVISNPKVPLRNPFIVSNQGQPFVLPATGGISYNVLVGDSVFDFEGDHIEPCVIITREEKAVDQNILGGLNVLSCIGNEAFVVSGPETGSKGMVTGKHGGVEHVLIDFPNGVLERLAIGDRIQVRAYGQGLQLLDFPQIHVMNISPGLLERMGITQNKGQLVVPVTHVIPSSILGSGYGSRHSYSGDIDIQIPDKDAVQRYGLQKLRIGDVIAIRDLDARYGRVIRNGAMSIGVIVHASCLVSGHGPGVTMIMSTTEKSIMPKIEDDANIGRYLSIGRWRKKPAYRRRTKK